MKKKLILFFSFISCCIWSTRGACLSDDSLFFAQKKGLLTATWKEPFSYNSIKSNHAPLGPYLGNGDVGVVAFTSDNSQTLKISKVDFVTDGWNDWAGSGPAALPVGGVSITVNSSVYSGFTSVNYPDTTAFNYQMDQLAAELRMRTATAQPVQMTSWMGSSENVIVTELTTTSKEAVSVSVNTYADSQSEHYATTADLQGDLQLVTRQTKREGVRWISQAGISTKIIGATASNEKLSDSMVRSTFRLMPSDTVLVVAVTNPPKYSFNRCKSATCKFLFRDTKSARDKNGTKPRKNKVKNTLPEISLVEYLCFVCKGTNLSLEKRGEIPISLIHNSFSYHCTPNVVIANGFDLKQHDLRKSGVKFCFAL